MNAPQTYVGVDVAKHWIDVFTATNQQFNRIANRRECLAKWVTELVDATIIFEVTGRYDHLLRAILEENGVP